MSIEFGPRKDKDPSFHDADGYFGFGPWRSIHPKCPLTNISKKWALNGCAQVCLGCALAKKCNLRQVTMRGMECAHAHRTDLTGVCPGETYYLDCHLIGRQLMVEMIRQAEETTCQT